MLFRTPDSAWKRSLMLAVVLTAALAACDKDSTAASEETSLRTLDPQLVAQGREIFRHDTFGNEVFWTDTARMHEVIASDVSPATALAVGLKVDADALPQAVKTPSPQVRLTSTTRRSPSRCSSWTPSSVCTGPWRRSTVRTN